MSAQVSAVALPGIGPVRAGDDLAALIVASARAAGVQLSDQDVVVVASKVVAKAEGRTVAAAARESEIDAASQAEVASRRLPDGRTTRVVRTRGGPVLAAAGIDSSDVPDGTVLLLPADPDASARVLRARLGELSGARPAVLVTDTSGRPWREGVTDFALGAAGLAGLDDVRGRLDATGRPLEVTVRNVADEVAALGDLVKDKAAGTPVAVVRGLGRHVLGEDGPGAAALVRGPRGDWFRHGHVEAVWAALGGPTPPPQPIDPGSEGTGERVARALGLALAKDLDEEVSAQVTLAKAGSTGRALAQVDLGGPPLALGRVAERLAVALWAEGLAVVASNAVAEGLSAQIGILPDQVSELA